MRLDRWDKRVAGGLVILVIIGLFSIPAFLFGRKVLKTKQSVSVVITENTKNSEEEVVETPVANPEPEAQPEVKEEIKKAPPKRTATPKTAVSTTTNSDGTQTSTLSEGGIPKDEVDEISELPPVSASPYSIRFSDETGTNGGLDKMLKDYLSGSLKWSNEISYLNQITVRNAGDTGWEGQYAGSYRTDRNGTIVSAFGYIVLNTYYHQSSPNFNDYMKLVLSHEYGHHFTLYHKWVDMNLGNSVRFPDSYYNIRPLSKATTAVDYSLGWQNCEAEIIAEDYSYFYSGYNYHAMVDFGYSYPSAATKTWIAGLSGAGTTTPPPTTPPATTDNPPTVNIVSPSNGASLTGEVEIQATASDDKGVTKVEFYVDNTLVSTDTTSPYASSINIGNYPGGQYQIQAKAYDAIQSSTASLNVTFLDTVLPTGNITPSDSPIIWNDNRNLDMSLFAQDNTQVVKVKLYLNDNFQQEVTGVSSTMVVNFSLSKNMPIGVYTIKLEIFDLSGNKGVVTSQINKV